MNGLLAAEASTSTINTALSSSFSQVSNDAMSVIATSLPYALTIVGAVIVVSIGIKVFKKVASK